MKFFQLSLFEHAFRRLRTEIPPVLGLLGVNVKVATKTEARRTYRKQAKSDAQLLGVWIELRKSYFPERTDIDSYTVCWSSRRQLRTLASCSLSKHKVNVARELNYADFEKWLPPLLYHEMCHAVLGVGERFSQGRREIHGRAFKDLEKRHPLTREFSQWIKSGGWLHAVRSSRTREYHQRKKLLKPAA